MNGPKVYGIAVKTMINDVRQVLKKYNEFTDEPIDVDDIGYIYPHQANLRIIESVADGLGVSLEKVYTNGIVNYGNTSTASIPIGYCDENGRSDSMAGGRFEIDVAFGAGFASGAILREV